MTSPRVNPTEAQMRTLYRQCYRLTNVFVQPIYLVRLDERTGNLFILAGVEESLELQIKPDGELI